MAKPKRPRLTLMDARIGPIPDLVDRLVDASNVNAASIIRQLDRHRVDLALLHIVSSVDERWRVRSKPAPLPAGTDDQERMRTAIADILTANPAAIVPALLALSDATAAHDPRRQDDDKAAA